MAQRRPRRKPDGSYELPYSCPVCGGSKVEINSVSRLFYCWSCSHSGRGSVVEVEAPFNGTRELLLSSKNEPTPHDVLTGSSSPSTTLSPPDLTDKLPLFALKECERRRQEPQWLIRRYGVRWSYQEGRLWWPTGPDRGVLRSVLSWETPKTKTRGPKGLIGSHLLKGKRGVQSPSAGCSEQVVQGAEPGVKVPPASNLVARDEGGYSPQHAPLRIVLVEGDWKAASIPLPWVGLGLCGLHLSAEQRDEILFSSPEKVFVLLDGGYVREAQKIVEALLPLPSVRLDLPWKGGPDDGPRGELVRFLLEAEQEVNRA